MDERGCGVGEGIVVSDADCPSVATAADYALPKTGVVCEGAVGECDQRSGVDLNGCLGEETVKRKRGEEVEGGREGVRDNDTMNV